MMVSIQGKEQQKQKKKKNRNTFKRFTPQNHTCTYFTPFRNGQEVELNPFWLCVHIFLSLSLAQHFQIECETLFGFAKKAFNPDGIRYSYGTMHSHVSFYVYNNSSVCICRDTQRERDCVLGWEKRVNRIGRHYTTKQYNRNHRWIPKHKKNSFESTSFKMAFIIGVSIDHSIKCVRETRKWPD